MRLAAQIKQGFYPIHPELVREWAKLLYVERLETLSILDPCAGQGEALDTLAQSLGVPQERCYAIELDIGRGKDVATRMPNARVLEGTDSLTAKISNKSFGLVWCNPPFDDECGGGGREEANFLNLATRVLVPGGVIGFVLPKRVLKETHEILYAISSWYTDVVVFVPPPEYAPFGEVIVTGIKRKEAQWERRVLEEVEAPWQIDRSYVVPCQGHRPRLFAKGAPTPLEVIAMLRSSAGARIFDPPPLPKPKRPLLPLSNGHASLLVASGQIDGVVVRPGEPPHVVRGMTKKQNVEVSTESDENKTVTTYVERLIPVVRVVDHEGNIRTFE